MYTSFVKILFLEFITWPTGLDWSPIEFSIILRNLSKFACFLLQVNYCEKVDVFLLPLFNTEAVFSFFELPLDLLADVSVVFTGVCLISDSYKCFSFFISSCSSFTFRLCWSLFLMFEIHNFLEGIFHFLLHRLDGLSERSFSFMFELLLWSILSVLIIPLIPPG